MNSQINNFFIDSADFIILGYSSGKIIIPFYLFLRFSRNKLFTLVLFKSSADTDIVLLHLFEDMLLLFLVLGLLIANTMIDGFTILEQD